MAKDIYHDIVKRALQKDGWTITHDPYKIPLANRTLKADLGAEKTIAAERGLEKIVVEVKSFLRDSFIYDFHEAFGQYLVYRRFIDVKEPERLIYINPLARLFAHKPSARRMTSYSQSSPMLARVFTPATYYLLASPAARELFYKYVPQR